MSDRDGADASPGTSASRAVLVGHLVVTLPVLLLIALFALVGSALDRAAVGMLLGALVGWVVWSFLVPRWRDWVAGTDAPRAEVQRLAQATGLVWRQGSLFERTEMPRKDGHRGG